MCLNILKILKCMYTKNTTLVSIEQNDACVDFYNTKNESHVDKKM